MSALTKGAASAAVAAKRKPTLGILAAGCVSAAHDPTDRTPSVNARRAGASASSSYPYPYRPNFVRTSATTRLAGGASPSNKTTRRPAAVPCIRKLAVDTSLPDPRISLRVHTRDDLDIGSRRNEICDVRESSMRARRALL